MRKTNSIITLIVLLISAVIGYNTGPNKANAANEPIIPKFIDVPRTTNGFNLKIDLNRGEVSANNTENSISVDIRKKDSIIYKYIPVYTTKYTKVRELPAMKKKRTFVSQSFELPKHICVK